MCTIPNGWIPVRDGKNLPVVGQEIWFVRDLRNTQTGYWTKVNLVTVQHGWVNEVAEENGWYINVRRREHEDSSSYNFGNADYVLYWQPFYTPEVYIEPRPEFEDDITLIRRDGSYVYDETSSPRQDIS